MYKRKNNSITLGRELVLVNSHALDQSNKEPQNKATNGAFDTLILKALILHLVHPLSNYHLN